MTNSQNIAGPRRGPLIALLVAIAVVVAAAATGIGIAIGASGGDPASGVDRSSARSASPSSTADPVADTGQSADFARARDAAEGAVTGSATEIKREGAGWEVDVRKDGDAQDIDVVLGSDFSVTRDGDPDGTADGGDVRPIGTFSGDALGRAIDAALEHAGSGTVTSIELADTGSEAYEVKVSRSGAEQKVVLGKDFSVLRTEEND